jgi:hypothetical protein
MLIDTAVDVVVQRGELLWRADQGRVGPSHVRIGTGLWDGELSVVNAIDDANDVLGTIAIGLCCWLSNNRDRNDPLRLMRVERESTCSSLKAKSVDCVLQRIAGNSILHLMPVRRGGGAHEFCRHRLRNGELRCQ